MAANTANFVCPRIFGSEAGEKARDVVKVGEFSAWFDVINLHALALKQLLAVGAQVGPFLAARPAVWHPGGMEGGNRWFPEAE